MVNRPTQFDYFGEGFYSWMGYKVVTSPTVRYAGEFLICPPQDICPWGLNIHSGDRMCWNCSQFTRNSRVEKSLLR